MFRISTSRVSFRSDAADAFIGAGYLMEGAHRAWVNEAPGVCMDLWRDASDLVAQGRAAMMPEAREVVELVQAVS